MNPTVAYLNHVGTAVPGHDIHHPFIEWASERLTDSRERRLFDRMTKRSGIDHRWSVLPRSDSGGSPLEPGGFYELGRMPGTAARMARYTDHAPALAMAAIDKLTQQVAIDDATHLVVASCTGFVAPGIDQIIARRLGLSPSIERLLVGFMGCYAAVAALRSARHIVRSQPDARVLVVCIELSSLHLQPANDPESLLAMLQFGDGAAAAMVSAAPHGLAIEQPFATTLPQSDSLIRWDITDTGFAMHLSGEVPGRIAEALSGPDGAAHALGGRPVESIDGWAVHPGGRSILDSVERGLGLSPNALDISREVLRANGNMSSATLMFVLGQMLGRDVANGVAIAFGPGLAAEGFAFRSAP